MIQTKLLEEYEPTSSHDLTMQSQQNNNDTEIVEDKDKDSDYQEDTTDGTMSSLAASTEHGVQSLGTSSHHTSASCDVECRGSSPTRKRKSESDVCNAIKRIKSNIDLANEFDGITHTCVKCRAEIKHANDKRNVTWLTIRFTQH